MSTPLGTALDQRPTLGARHLHKWIIHALILYTLGRIDARRRPKHFGGSTAPSSFAPFPIRNLGGKEERCQGNAVRGGGVDNECGPATLALSHLFAAGMRRFSFSLFSGARFKFA
ncbi:hypothetical protein MRX96_005129 [Rhipicephalus microplus]